MGDELVKEQQAHSETRDQLTAAQKGAQSSALMDLELQDYQRSIKSLEDKVAGKGVELEAAHKENLTYREKIEQLKKELGEFIRMVFCRATYVHTYYNYPQCLRTFPIIMMLELV